MRRGLSCIMLLVLLCAGASAGWSNGFPDVSFDHWAYDEIMACVGSGVVSGYDDGFYQPDWTVTRGQMAVFVSRGLVGGDENVPGPTVDPGFTDVDDTHWAYKYICYVVAQNIASGYPEGDYRPDQAVTRDQMAVYVARAMVAPTTSVLDDYEPADPRNFPDVPSDHWAYPYVEYCVEAGVVGGYPDGNYLPDQEVKRDQMAVYVSRAYDLLSPFAGTYAASYSSGVMTMAVDAVGETTLAITDDSLGVLTGTGTVSDTGTLAATASQEGSLVSAVISGLFSPAADTILGSGSISGSISAAWTAEKVADLGINAFAGSWSGEYWGAEWGTWEAEVYLDGSVTATAQSPSVGPVTLSGEVEFVGAAVLEGSGSGIGGPFTITWEGMFYLAGGNAYGDGDWESTSGFWGWWSGERE